MDVTGTQGAPEAASPTATPGAAPTGATPAAPPAAKSGFDAKALESMMAGESPPPADDEVKAEGDQDPSKPEAAEPDQEKKADDEAPKDKTKARMDQLLKERAETRQELQKYKAEAQQKEVRFTVALKKVLDDNATLKAQLSQYEDLDTPEHKLGEIESRQKVQAELRAKEQQLQQRLQEEQDKAQTSELQSELYDAMDDALSGFEHLTREQLQRRFSRYAKQNPGVTFEQAPGVFADLAKELDAEYEALYEARVLKKHAPKLTAHSPVTSSGTVRRPSRPSTTDEIASELDRAFGPGYFG